jgi:hypothetical protein
MKQENKTLLKSRPSEIVTAFVNQYCSMFDMDVLTSLKYMKNGEYFEILTQRWYDALLIDDMTTAYSIYDDDYYFTDLWNCFTRYSRQYLMSMSKESLPYGNSILSYMGEIDTVVDLGCGIGMTTRCLKEMFPSSRVYGTNIPNTSQWKWCQKMSSEHNFTMVQSVAEVSELSIDLIFASEYFEHIEKPIEHVGSIITQKTPKFFVIANSFNTRSIGHFTSYIHNGEKISQQKISKMFNQSLRDFGYTPIRTGIFNDTPKFWARNDQIIHSNGAAQNLFLF